MKRFPILFLSLLFAFSGAMAKDYTVSSPDSRILVTVSTGEKTTWSVSFDGKTILDPSPLSMTFSSGRVIGDGMKVTSVVRDSRDAVLAPVVRQKCASLRDNYNEMTLRAKDYSIVFRVYDDGAAYRFRTDFRTPEVTVLGEEVDFCFPEDLDILFSEERSMLSAQQPLFYPKKLSEIQSGRFCSTPLLVKAGDNVRVLVSESDLESYPGMFLEKQGRFEMKGKFAGISLEEYTTEDRQIFPTKRAPYIAVTSGKRNYPWRAMVISPDDAGLLESQLIYKLAPDPEVKDDFSWVKPGKIAWDWWNALALYGVDFKAGINTETYKYYVDFAAANNIEYVVIDDGWSEAWDVTATIPEIDMPGLISYAGSKNVGIILWVSWAPFEKQMDEAFELYSKWGVKGLKIDFMNRDDQYMVDFYYRVARKAIDYRMLIDFHGAYKPTGWSRTFPHVLTSEGVAGLENCKWGDFITPTHDCTLPFTRMVAGPMDYTPGGMTNFHQKDFKIWFDTPATIGTRCHQLGMYVVYESPLQMLADSPSNYMREPGCMEFLSQVPVVWDETIVLEARIGEYVLVARRSGDKWYIGGLCGDKGRTFDVDLDFISGDRTLRSWEDGINVEIQARDFAQKTMKVSKGDRITVRMYDGGGYAAIIE
ncbi:MAG: glycoside hydrolase family 97 protein [Candidatus Cryptobacteroides sp.]